MDTCYACRKPFDSQAFPVGLTGYCAICARHTLDWINHAIISSILEEGEDPGLEYIEAEKYYYVQIVWYGSRQIHVEFTIDGEADGPGQGRSDGIFSGLELALMLDLTNRTTEIEMVSYICCASGRVMALNELIPEW